MSDNNQTDAIASVIAPIADNPATSEAREETKVNSSEISTEPLKRSIFRIKSKQSAAKDRFNQRAQEYLETYKMSIYL